MTSTLAETERAEAPHVAALMSAALMVCGLLVAEDATVLAVRSSARAGVPGTTVTAVTIDLALAAVMLAYNYAASRYVARATAAIRVGAAIGHLDACRRDRVDEIRRSWLRAARRALRHANPFELVKVAAERFGHAADHLGVRAADRGLGRTTRLFGDLARVNIMGVPGASLEQVARGVPVRPKDSFRHCWLFVASWFAGARCVEALVSGTRDVPIIGAGIADVTRTIGTAFTTITDVTQPIGAVAVAAVLAAVTRYAVRVARVCRQGHV